jgi:hypothetical protein
MADYSVSLVNSSTSTTTQASALAAAFDGQVQSENDWANAFVGSFPFDRVAALAADSRVSAVVRNTPTSWQSSHCVDGDPLGLMAACAPGVFADISPSGTTFSCGDLPECGLSNADLIAMGYDLTNKRLVDAAVVSEFAAAHGITTWSIVDTRPSSQSGTSNDTGAMGLKFDLIFDNDELCHDMLVYNNRCGKLWHTYYEWYTDPSTGAGMFYPQNTAFGARAGDNLAAHQWQRSVGPLPDNAVDNGTGVPSNGIYRLASGYQRSTNDSFDPGWFNLSPWTMHSPPTEGARKDRSEMEIHGGKGSHAYLVMYTNGCIRLSQDDVNRLMALWDNTIQPDDAPPPLRIDYSIADVAPPPHVPRMW